MKTLMTINGMTLLLPDTTTDKAIMDLITNLRGAMVIQERANYGPEGDRRYDEDHGYFRAQVITRPAGLRIELAASGDVMTEREFNDKVEYWDTKNNRTNLPAAA